MSRRLQRLLIALAALLVLGVALVWTLPVIVRWQALKQIPVTTGRAVSIEDIDINLFTGRVAIKNFRLAEQDPAQTFVEFERLDVRVVPWSPLFGHIRIAEFVLTAPTVNLVRLSPTEFNFSDILARLAASPAPAPPTPAEPELKTRGTVGIERFALIRANLTFIDRAVKPASEWKVRDLSIEAGNLTTRPEPVGKLAVKAALNDSPIEFSAQDIDLTPTSFAGKFSIQNFNLLQVRPYLPPLPATLESGIAGVNIAMKLELGPGPGGLTVGMVTGDVAVTSLALAQPGKTTPFLTVPRIGVGLKEVNLVSRVVTLSGIDVEGLDLRAVRDKQEQIDLLELARTPEEGKTGGAIGAAGGGAATGASSSNALGSPSAAPRKAAAPDTRAPAAPSSRAPAGPAAGPGGAKPAEPEYKITIEKVSVKGVATFTDESVSSPPTVLKVGDLALQVDDVTWPAVRPMSLALTMLLPGGGKFGAKGPVKIDPVDVTLAVTTRDAPIEPYGAYFPFPASFSGRFNADSQNRIRVAGGKFTALSRGNTWATNLAVKGPDAQEAPLRLEWMEITGIDFGWPTHARVARVLLRKPANEIDRAADGTLNVQKLFTPAPKPGAAAPPVPAKPPAPPAKPGPAGRPEAKPPDLLQTMELYFKEIVIEDGYIRFLDHTTQPAFSNDISKLNLSVKNLSNKPSQRASVLMTAVIGGDSTLDVRGELSGIGAPTYVNMATELNKFALPSANPYVDGAIAWIIRRGELTAKLDTKIDGDKLDAKNDILIGDLRVAKSRPNDEVKNRLGLPLGLIVALIKDGDGNIHVNVPITGTLTDQKFDFSDAIWTAVKNVLVNVLKAPFRAIGGLFTSKDDKIEELKVDPIVFPPGVATLTPDMERQTVRVGDFLRRAPYVSLTLSSVTSPEDVEELKAREVVAKLEYFQKQQGISDRARALRRYYQVNLKDVPVPATVDQQIALLRKREPEPIGPLDDLRRRRLDVTRERLAKVEGIPEARLRSVPAGASTPAVASAPSEAAPNVSAAPTPGAAPPSAPTSAPVAPGPPADASAAASGTAGGGRVEFGIVGEGD